MIVKTLIRSLTRTPQTAALPGRAAEQVPNSAGGFVWRIDLWKQLERFLILGAEGGTFYIEERKLTLDNATSVLASLKTDGERAVETVTAISTAGRAPRNTPALFVLALAAAPQFADSRTNARTPQRCRGRRRFGPRA
jgi:60 kDa SS-A/Ro ribonucleoprotein